jgi:hypothetical protein
VRVVGELSLKGELFTRILPVVVDFGPPDGDRAERRPAVSALNEVLIGVRLAV